MSQPVTTHTREQDGKFAHQLSTNAAVLRDQMREEARRRREEQLRKENEAIAAMGYDPAELFL